MGIITEGGIIIEIRCGGNYGTGARPDPEVELKPPIKPKDPKKKEPSKKER